MTVRNDIETHFLIDGKPVLIKLINNPLIDDVVVSEARAQATAIERGTIDPDRRVARDLRDFLVRIGVER